MSIVYKQKVFDSLQELRDEKYQRRAWLSSSGPEISSFVEAICGLFDDSGLGDALDKEEVVFTGEIDRLLRELRQAVQATDQALPPAQLIIDKKMVAIRELATMLLHLIKNN
jgi:hypothetical protein